MQRSERRGERRPERSQQVRRQRQAVAEGRKERTGFRQFLREVRQELKKVAWPTRRELFAYTLVVLVSVVVLTSFVFALDFLISKGVLIVFGTDTFPLRDPRRFALAILTNAFGGGMSSRLFQRIREELGLAYAIYAYKNFYRSSGQLGVYVGTQVATADRAVDAIRDEYARLAREGLPTGELINGKQQLKGQIMLTLESPGARMARLAGFMLYDDRYRPLDRHRARSAHRQDPTDRRRALRAEKPADGRVRAE
jgi:preprotein translocase SecE subunit